MAQLHERRMRFLTTTLSLLLLLQGELVACLISQSDNQRMLSPKVYDTILSGQIAVVPNFLPAEEIRALKEDAQGLHAAHRFSTSALTGYGSSGKFDPAKDRAVLKLDQWKNIGSGNWETRSRLGNRMAALRSDLAYNLGRPSLNRGIATTKYGAGSTEISYTRFGPGAFLKRHVDEHHEEIKGKAGWSQPTRRSVSWLVYLNEDWKGRQEGGQLRCFQRVSSPCQAVGARPNGDLQIGWLRASSVDPLERPVFLDGRQEEAGRCAMYIVQEDGRTVDYITSTFDAHPVLYVAGAEAMVKRILVNRRDLADRFHFIMPPKSMLGDILTGKQDYAGTGEDPAMDEVTNDIDPTGGTLVMFDSVSLPHEVLATRSRDRWATSGWFHEDQQPIRGDRSPV